MTTLHTVNKSPFERNALDSCLRLATEGAAVLLFEDAVIGARAGTRIADTIKAAMPGLAFYVLGPDLAARGIREDALIEGIRVVDYPGFGELTVSYDKGQAWL